MPDSGAPGSGGAAAQDGGTPGDGAIGGATAGVCPSPTPPPAPLRRLTRFEYNNTVRDLFLNGSRPADSLPADGFSNVTTETRQWPELADDYHRLAHDFAIAATSDAPSVIALAGCDPATGEAACEQKIIRELVPRVFRRAAAPEDATEFGEVFAAGRRLGGDFASGLRAVVEVALQSPEFLYRVEFGEALAPAQPPLARPTPHEMAARLSFFLWGSTPDAMLLDAAAQGKLRTKTEIEAQARRLLADDRAHEMVRYFTFQLMGLHDVAYLKDHRLDLNPGLTSQIVDLLLQETRLFIDEVTWQGPGDFQALFTAPVSFLNGPLATYYGVPGVTGDAFRKVNLDPAQRGGLLTQPSLLASTSHGPRHSPTGRGSRVFQQVLCRVIALPPVIDDVPPTPLNATTREAFEQISSNPTCATCHKDLDPIGFAFEHYDAVGRWRDMENGRPIDATGELFQTDAKGKFNGAIELAQRLAASQDAKACYVGKWMAFTYGRAPSPDDACSRKSLMDAFARTNGNVRELLVALTQTDAFVTRPVTQP